MQDSSTLHKRPQSWSPSKLHRPTKLPISQHETVLKVFNSDTLKTSINHQSRRGNRNNHRPHMPRSPNQGPNYELQYLHLTLLLFVCIYQTPTTTLFAHLDSSRCSSLCYLTLARLLLLYLLEATTKTILQHAWNLALHILS